MPPHVHTAQLSEALLTFVDVTARELKSLRRQVVERGHSELHASESRHWCIRTHWLSRYDVRVRRQSCQHREIAIGFDSVDEFRR